jgi:hypothetical protein
MYYGRLNIWGRNLLMAFLPVCLGSLGFIAGCREGGRRISEVRKRPPIAVNAGVDKAVAATGDVITYTVTVDRSPEVVVRIPEFGAEIADFRIVDMGTEGPKEIEGRVVIKKWYKLRADTAGSYIIPPVKLAYRPKSDAAEKEIQTSQIFVEVKPDTPARERQKDIIDIKPLEEPQINYLLWLTVIGGAVTAGLLVAGGIICYRRRKKGGEATVKPPAHEAALAELNKLKGVKYNDVQEIKRLYFNLSEIFRRYLEERYGFPATDWTSEEIISQTNKNRELTFELKEQSKLFLHNTDLVKFAESIPGDEQIQEELNRAISFVEATKEVTVEGSQADAVRG